MVLTATSKKAAAVLKGHQVAESVSLVCGISSRQIYLKLMEDGVIGDLLNAGARVLELACGPCCGIGCAPIPRGFLFVRPTATSKAAVPHLTHPFIL